MSNNFQSGIAVRLYLSESEDDKLQKIINFLHDIHNVKGVTAFRGIEGFGQSGQIHSANLIALSNDLPITLEFFDTADKMRAIFNDLQTMVKPGHMISWPVTIN